MTQRLAGATTEGTRRRAAEAVEAGRHPSAFSELGRTGLVVSGIGFGGYRIRESEDDHRSALAQALAMGCNLVDTSTNYGDGSSERLIGAVLPVEVERDEAVVVSKVGYVQGSLLRELRQRERNGDAFPEMVRFSENCWHCIHPTFLAEQIGRSIERLDCGRVDVMLLHNPEYFLIDRARHSGLSLARVREIYYGRIQRAFEHLESEVAAGRIGYYGVSSNTLVASSDRADATGLDELLEAARAAGGDAHHFAVVQFPVNLLERGALAHRLLERSAEAGLGVLVNRPLNALEGGQIVRLADFSTDAPKVRVDRLIRAVERLEDEFTEGLGQTFEFDDIDPERGPFRYATLLRERGEGFGDVVAWDHWVETRFGPEVSRLVNRIDDALSGPIKMPWKFWLERYVDAVGALIDGLRVGNARISQRRSVRIAGAIDGLLADGDALPLSQKAVAVLRGLPGVSSVLVGMRQPAYVVDMMSVLDRERPAVSPQALADAAVDDAVAGRT